MTATSSGSTRNFIPMHQKYDRIVLLVDMDCFYCQVEEKLDPTLKGQPLAVVQYNAWRGGGIIAVNYAARAQGVTRHMRGDEAKEQCPDIVLAKVPNIREKADLTKYREAGKDVANVLQRFTPLLERASVDEAYLDITSAVNKRLESMNAGTFVLQPTELVNTFAVGYNSIGDYVTAITARIANPYAEDDNYECAHDADDVPAVRQSDIRLLIGASIASEIRAAVKSETGYECSAGIAHNKILAKLACGINKPNKQTILSLAQIPSMFETLPVGKIKGLGAKYGEEVCERMGVKFLGQLLKFTEAELQKKFDEKNGSWLYNICRGIDLEAVTPRFYSKSIGCCKKFPGRNNITGLNTLRHWLKELAQEIIERLEKDIIENNRRARQMVVSFVQEFDGEEVSSSRSAALGNYDQDTLAAQSFEVIKSNTKQLFRAGSETVLNNPIKFLGISVGKFETITNAQHKLQEMFANQAAKKRKSNELEQCEQPNEATTTIAVKPKENPKQKGIIQSFFANHSRNKIDTKNDDDDKNTPNVMEQDNTLIGQQPLIDGAPKETTSKSFFLTALKRNNAEEAAQKEITAKQDNKRLKSDAKDVQQSFFLNQKTGTDAPVSNSSEEFALFSDTVDIEPSKENGTENDVDLIENEDQALKQTHDEEVEIEENNANSTPAVELFVSQQVTEDYKANYAEFAVPELLEEMLQYIKCDICGQKLLADERIVQTHQDLHFAQQLSQQQRDVFRAEIKTKANTSKSTVESNAKAANRNRATTSKKTDISKFLKPTSSQALQTETPTQGSEMQTCDECQLLLPSAQMSEHKDFHVAKQLQRALNRVEVRTVTIPKKTNAAATRNGLNTTSLRTSKVKPITQFFSQSNE